MGEISNPILRGFYPDPSICRVEDDYYLVNSTFAYAPGVPIFHSTDLIHWKQLGHVLERRSQLNLENARMSDGIYAPTLRFHNGIFYMITTNVKGGGNFYVTAKTPAGPWSDPVYLPDAQGFDPSLFFEEDKCYYIGQRAKKEAKYPGDCEIWIQELDLEKGELTGADYAVWDGALKTAFWVEGPHLYKRNGYYYILTAEGGTAFEHSICVARSKSLLGEYEACPLNPIFTHRHLGKNSKIQNIGHGDLVETKGGHWYIVMLGTRPIEGCAPLGRETFLAEVIWENDWPVINPGEGKIREIQIIHEEINAKNKNMEKTNEKEQEWEPPIVWGMPMDKRCVYFRFPEENMYYIADKGKIGLKLLPQTIEDIASPAYIGIRVDTFDFAIRTSMDFWPQGTEEAGLLYLYDEKNYVKFVITGAICFEGEGFQEMKAVIVENGIERILSTCAVTGSHHYIGFRLDGLRLDCILDGEEFVEEIDVRNLTTEVTYGFVGCSAGIYASSNHGERDKNRAAFFTELLL